MNRCWRSLLGTALAALSVGPVHAQVNSREGNALPFQINDVEYARISETAGNLGIGTTHPVAKLTVAGNVSVTGMIDVGHTAQACATAISGSIRFESVSDTLQICTSAGWKSLTSASTVGNATVASSTGAVQFNNGGQLAGDTSNLFWDDTNNRLGIGTAIPSGVLHTSGSLAIMETGTNRQATFQTLSALPNVTDDTTYGPSIGFSRESDGANNIAGIGAYNSANLFLGAYSNIIFGSGANGTFNNAYERLRITSSGDVGIGTAAPDSKLDVNGQITGGFGAVLTTGTLDWNDATNARPGSGYTLLMGNAANGPSAAAYFHPFSFEYNTKNGTGNLTQFAIPYYTTSNAYGMYWRTRYSGTWSNWHKFVTTDDSGDVGIGTTNPNAKLDVIGTVSATALSGDGTNVTGVIHGVSVTTYATAGTYFYAPPANTTLLEIIVQGGGGGGGGVDGQNTAGYYALSGGGGAGGWSEAFINNPATSYTVVVGDGGAGGAAGANSGATGGTTFFNGTGLSVQATGGSGGTGETQAASGNGNSGYPGTSSGGDINGTAPHGYEITRWVSGANTNAWDGAHGQPSRFGRGGTYGANAAGSAALYCGAGGGGSYYVTQSATNYAGGAGKAGCVVIKAYY